MAAQQYICTHTTCTHGKYNEPATYASKGKRDHHERTAKCHPCCASTVLSKCPTGQKIALWYALPKMDNKEEITQHPFPCRHTNCTKSFPHQSNRSTHERKIKHMKCDAQCIACSVILIHKHEVPPPPPDPPFTKFLAGLQKVTECPPSKIEGEDFAAKFQQHEIPTDNAFLISFHDGVHVLPYDSLQQSK